MFSQLLWKEILSIYGKLEPYQVSFIFDGRNKTISFYLKNKDTIKLCFVWLKIREMAHLLDWMKVRIIEILQEPQDTRSEYLSEKQYKWCKVEDVDHTNKPVKKHGCT